MDSLQRAKRFIAAKASRLALAAVPLAALAISAIPAHAGNIQLSSGNNCFVDPSSGGSCSTFQQSSIGGNPALNWVALGGSSGEFFTGGSISFSASGSATGEFLAAGSIPVSWDFSTMFELSPSQADSVDWTVTFGLETSNGPVSFTSGGIAFLGTEVTGTGTIADPSGGTVSGYFMSLAINESSNITTFNYSVDIPGETSLDLNPQGTAAPEPGTFALLLSGAGALLFLRRKKLS